MRSVFAAFPKHPSVHKPADKPELQGGITQQTRVPENHKVKRGGDDVQREPYAAPGGHAGNRCQAEQGGRPFQREPGIHGRENRVSAQDVVAAANPFAKKLFF
jgi:hypothetical protein